MTSIGHGYPPMIPGGPIGMNSPQKSTIINQNTDIIQSPGIINPSHPMIISKPVNKLNL